MYTLVSHSLTPARLLLPMSCSLNHTIPRPSLPPSYTLSAVLAHIHQTAALSAAFLHLPSLSRLLHAAASHAETSPPLPLSLHLSLLSRARELLEGAVGVAPAPPREGAVGVAPAPPREAANLVFALGLLLKEGGREETEEGRVTRQLMLGSVLAWEERVAASSSSSSASSPIESPLEWAKILGGIAALLPSSPPSILPPSTLARWARLTHALLPAVHLHTLATLVEAGTVLNVWKGGGIAEEEEDAQGEEEDEDAKEGGAERLREEEVLAFVREARAMLPKLVVKAKARARVSGRLAWGKGAGKEREIRRKVERRLQWLEEGVQQRRARAETLGDVRKDEGEDEGEGEGVGEVEEELEEEEE